MGATILRWFWRDGVRYHAFFRSTDGDAAGRELVVAVGSRSHAVPASAVDTSLDELPEERLLGLALALDMAARPEERAPVEVQAAV